MLLPTLQFRKTSMGPWVLSMLSSRTFECGLAFALVLATVGIGRDVMKAQSKFESRLPNQPLDEAAGRPSFASSDDGPMFGSFRRLELIEKGQQASSSVASSSAPTS